MALEWNFSQV